ncbi:MAG: CoA transferase, partial [Burkholderiales bacterium]
MTNQEPLLKGLKVVDLGVGMAAAIVTRYLADAGASVTRIEPDGGDPFSSIYPAYAFWRRDHVDADRSELNRLVTQADVCVVGGEDHPELPKRIGAKQVAGLSPRLVVLDINQGPAASSIEHRPATDLLAQARSGLAWEQRADRPVAHAFEPASYGAAMQGLIGMLAALYEREASGLGQVVTTSLLEGALAWVGVYWCQLERPTPAATFKTPRGVVPTIFRTRDGMFIHLVIGGSGSKYKMYKALGIVDPKVTPTSSSMPQLGAGPRHFFGDCDLLAQHVAKLDGRDALEAIWAEGLPAEPVLQPGGCWNDPQVDRNRIIVSDSQGRRGVGLPFLCRLSPADSARSAKPGVKPLDGVRIVDCGAFVAGPLASTLLTDLGAEVIKVEPVAGDPNRAIFASFTVANRGKKSVAIDSKHPIASEYVRALCLSADVVMNNFRPGVSARLGVDPASLLAARSDLVVLESPAYGVEGPHAQKSGFDMVMQAYCGHEVRCAGAGNDPDWDRINIADFTGGMMGAVAILTALVHRARSGNGVSL